MTKQHKDHEQKLGQAPATTAAKAQTPKPIPIEDWPKELGGPKGPEPTRYGDWEHNGRCSDF